MQAHRNAKWPEWTRTALMRFGSVAIVGTGTGLLLLLNLKMPGYLSWR